MRDNKQLMQDIFAELANGNGRPFVDAMADDFTWIMTGTTSWSGTYRGKKTVQEQVLRPLFERFAGTYTNHAERIHADGDFVIVECRGKVMTKAGKPYNNRYCYVCRLADGQLKELTEYFDTELVTAALGERVPKAPAAAHA